MDDAETSRPDFQRASAYLSFLTSDVIYHLVMMSIFKKQALPYVQRMQIWDFTVCDCKADKVQVSYMKSDLTKIVIMAPRIMPPVTPPPIDRPRMRGSFDEPCCFDSEASSCKSARSPFLEISGLATCFGEGIEAALPRCTALHRTNANCGAIWGFW